MRQPWLSPLSCLVVAAACATPPTSPTPPAPAPATTTTAVQPIAPQPQVPSTWDLDAFGVPRFVDSDYIDVGRIAAISRFRSAEGHDYSDDLEGCRSMKHYFRPASQGAGSIRIIAPVTGEVVTAREEWAGVQISIRPDDQPAFVIIIFHLSPSLPLPEGTRVTAGQLLGTHIGDQTWSDVAVRVSTPAGSRLVSWFDVMTDAVFDRYRTRGLTRREDAIITRAERDADPLSCESGAFLSRGRLDGWITLR